MLAAGALAAYVRLSESFSSTYGPLAGVFALLIWSLASAIAFFFGAAVCAQLEALRAGVSSPVTRTPAARTARSSTTADQAESRRRSSATSTIMSSWPPTSPRLPTSTSRSRVSTP